MDARTRQIVVDHITQLEIPFNREGIDPYGVSTKHLTTFLSMLSWFYRNYFRARAFGLEHVPSHGRAMLVGNHSGGFAVDAGMVIASCFLEMRPPRLAQGMADKFINRIPFASQWSNRTGQFTGLPSNAVRLLEDERVLMVFPEGHAGTAKLFHERYSLVKFGTGFVRLALQTHTPIIPFAFLGGGEAMPTIANLYKLGRLLGAPYIPMTPYLIPLPLPVPVSIHYGEPLHLSGTGTEDDAAVVSMVGEVKQRIAALIQQGRRGEAR